MRIKSLIKDSMEKILPAGMFVYLWTWKRGFSEPELRLLPYLCEKSKISIDIGADNGLYTFHMIKYSNKCYTFEPRVDAASRLNKLLSGLNLPVQVEPVALSDKPGKTLLKVFLNDLGRSTIEGENPVEKLGNVELVSVPVRRLDDYEFNKSIGCIKIDVEGHEEAVLRGAKQILMRDHPSLIVEVEERHKSGAVETVRSFLEELGYKGFFYRNHCLKPIELFDVNIHQNINNLYNPNKRRDYINNFVFVTNQSINKIQDLIA